MSITQKRILWEYGASGLVWVGMDKSVNRERLKGIMAILAPLYPDRRSLLEYRTSFELLVATVLAAQCTDAGVNRVTPELWKCFPGPRALAAAPLSELEAIVRPLGFFRVKARNIKALSARLVECFHSEVPGTMDELLSLAGVGRKTASVILWFCFGEPAIIVDTHFMRVTRRLGLSAAGTPGALEADIAAIADRAEWAALSLVLNRFGRTVCRAKRPACAGCPVRAFCSGQSQGGSAKGPEKVLPHE